MDNIKENLERAGSYILQEIMFSDFSLYLQNITKQEKFSRHTFADIADIIRWINNMFKIPDKNNNLY